jgi:hypothetical protein
LIFPDLEAVAFRVVVPDQHHHYTMGKNEKQQKKTRKAKKNFRAEIKKRIIAQTMPRIYGVGNFHHKRLVVWFLCHYP